MSIINLRRFVDINLQYHQKSSISSNRPVTVLLSSEGSSSTPVRTYVTYRIDNEGNYVFGYHASSSSAITYESLEDFPLAEAYAKIYFENNGNKLKIIYGATSENATSIVNNLLNEEIVVAGCGNITYAVLKGIAETRNSSTSIYGINEKILLGGTNSIDDDIVKNFAAKYSSVSSAEATIAAYLSNINLDGVDTVNDYAFTKENITPEASDDTVLGNVLDNNMNVVMNVTNANINLGGNLKNGESVVHKFALIVLQQTLTASVFNLLLTKIKGNRGLAAIQSTVANEMQKYLRNGYLTTDKIWKDETLTVSYNFKNYVIIEKDTPLIEGYRFVSLPISSLSEADIEARKTPPMYLIVAESYGIRVVTINGEVI